MLSRRYFTPEKDEDPGKSAESASSKQSGIQELVAGARKLVSEKKLVLAVALLEKAVEKHRHSNDIWIAYLGLKSQLTLSAELSELYTLFHTAVSSCRSYSVVWEVS